MPKKDKRGNGKTEVEHPKPLLEVMENTRSSVEGYAAAQGMSEEKAALILILNELRCIHWHFDVSLSTKEVTDESRS